MKNIYNDNQIMSPDVMDKIAREYSSQKTKKQKQLDENITHKLEQNLAILEYITAHQKNTPANLQRCLIKTYSLIKDSLENKKCSDLPLVLENTKYNKPISVLYSKQTCLNNSLDIILSLANSYKHILLDKEYKAIKLCVENIAELAK